MGQPTKFDGSNTIMRAPEGAENVQDMHVFRTRHSCVSCWEVSADELAEISRTGRIFLSVLMGGQQPPVYVGSESACREVLVDFGPVWPMADRPSKPLPDRLQVTGFRGNPTRVVLSNGQEATITQKLIDAFATPSPSQDVEGGEAFDRAKAEQAFTDYFVRNYPGPDTIIFDPKWHAPKLFAAAVNAIREAANA